MKKSLLLFAIFTLVGGSLFSQLSTRENNAVNVRLNTRPQAGDAALQFVFPLVDLSADDGSDAGLYKGNFLTSGDLLTFKYYNTDDVVIRAAFRFYADNDRMKGTVAESSDANPLVNDSTGVEMANIKSIDREYNIALGLEKHFTNSNIFDVYVGAEGRIGLGKDKEVTDYDYFNSDHSYTTRSTNTTIVGFAGVVGFNVFVAELPVSIGLEYGWGGKWIFGGNTKVTEDVDFGDTDVSYTEEWIESYDGTDTRLYSKLSSRRFNMDTNQNVRLNIHIYFSSKKGS